MKVNQLKKGQIVLFSTSMDWEGSTDESMCEVLKDFDIKAEWKGFEAMRYYKIINKTWKYDHDFWDALIRFGFLRPIEYVNADINSGKKKRICSVWLNKISKER